MMSEKHPARKHLPHPVKPVLLCSLIGTAAVALLLAGFSFLLTLQDLPHAAVEPLALLAGGAGWISLRQAPWSQRPAHRRRLRSDGVRDHLSDRMPDNGRGTGTLSLAEGIDFPVLRCHWRCFGGEHSPSGEIAIYTGMGFVV